MIRPRKNAIVLMSCLLIFGFAATGCVQLDVDPDPPYPQREWDYSYPEEEDLPAPWVDPEDYPYVTITSPANGGFAAPGAVAVTGIYEGPELASLTINGTPASISGNAFSGTVTLTAGQAMLDIEAEATTAERGRVSADRVIIFESAALTAESPVTYGVALDFENRGMDALADALADELDGLDFADLLGRRLTSGERGAIEVDKALIEDVAFTLKATEEGLLIRPVIGNIEVVINIFDLPLIDLKIEGLILELLAEIEVNEKYQIKINVVDSSVKIASLGIENGLLDEAASGLVSLVLDLLVDLLVPGALENLLSSLELNIGLTGATLSLYPAAALTTDRNLALSLHSQVTITDPSVWNEDFQPAGFRSTALSPSPFPEATPLTNKPYGLALGANDDFLNQLLYAVAATDTLNFTIEEEEIDAEILSLLFFSFETIDPASPVIIELAPTVAPLTVANPVDGMMHLALPGYTGRVLINCGTDTTCLARADQNGNWEAMSFAIDLDAPASLTISEDAISLLLSDINIGVNIIHNAVGQTNIDNLERLFAELFDQILPELLTELESIEFEMPELLGLSLTLPDMAVYGQDNLGIFLDLQ